MNESKDQNGTWDYPDWFFSMSRWSPGGPAFYPEENRLVPILYVHTSILTIIATAITFLLVVIVILPVIKHRGCSVLASLNAILVGGGIAMCMIVPEWLHGHDIIRSPVHYFSSDMVEMELGVHVGLTGFNVTLISVQSQYNEDQAAQFPTPDHLYVSEFYYNEHVQMFTPEHLDGVMNKALERGDPIPVLTALQCLTSAKQGFLWSHKVADIGYHCDMVLLYSLFVWGVTMIFIAVIPRYSSCAFVVIGVMMICTVFIYFAWVNIDMDLPCIIISDTFVELKYGKCFWACLGIGVWSYMYGFFLAIYDFVNPDKFLTVFDIDYDYKRTIAAAKRINYWKSKGTYGMYGMA